MLSSVADDLEDDGTAEFRACIKVQLADKVAILSRQCIELLDRSSKANAASNQPQRIWNRGKNWSKHYTQSINLRNRYVVYTIIINYIL